MIEIDLDRIAKRRKDILTDLGTNGLAKAALALGMVDRDVVALVAEIIRLNNELIYAQGDASPAVIWDEGYEAGASFNDGLGEYIDKDANPYRQESPDSRLESESE